MKAMILAAGLGLRMRPWTNTTPKPLLPLINIPLIRFSIELYRHHHFNDIIINTHHHPQQLEDYISTIKDITPTFSRESILLGSFGGLRTMWELTEQEEIICINSDIVTTLDLEALINFHKKQESTITLGLIPGKGDKTYTDVWCDQTGKIIQINGEPQNTNLISTHYCGIQILKPEILKWLEPNQIGDLSSLVYKRAIKENVPIFGYKSNALWLDAGQPQHFLNTNKELLNLLDKSDPYFLNLFKNINPTYKQISPGIFIGKNTTIESTVKLTSPLIIGENCHIEGNTNLGPHTSIGDNVTLNNVTKAENSVILTNFKKTGGVLKDSIF